MSFGLCGLNKLLDDDFFCLCFALSIDDMRNIDSIRQVHAYDILTLCDGLAVHQLAINGIKVK